MTKRPALSVVITAKNAERTILLAVLSALWATGKDDEVLVYLDACSDSSEEKLRNLRSRRLVVCSSKKPKGRTYGRNFLIGRARGDLIAILDADDVALPWAYRSAKRHLQHHDAVFSNALVFFESCAFPALIPQVPRAITAKSVARELCVRNPFVHSTAVIRKKSLQSLGGYRECDFEDYDLWLRMALDGFLMKRSRGYGAIYRVHDSQLSTSLKSHLEADDSIRVLKRNLIRNLFSPEVDGKTDSEISSHLLEEISKSGVLAGLELKGLRSFRMGK